MKPLIVIIGPTAIGKSAVAVQLAEKIDGEIVSADSVQVYRELNIGSAKISEDEKRGIPHHLLDIVSIKEEFSVAQYQHLAECAIGSIVARGKIPILVGGSGLYVSSILFGYKFPQHESTGRLRQQLLQEHDQKGEAGLREQLAAIDPAAVQKINRGDSRRLIRALEVYSLTGEKASLEMNQRLQRPTQKTVILGLYIERAQLYRNIELRVDAMMSRGLVNEVQQLLTDEDCAFSKALLAVGYKEIIGYLKGEYTLEFAVQLIKRNTRRFAKRQLTWFQRYQHAIWLPIDHMVGKGEVLAALMEHCAPLYRQQTHQEEEV